MSACWELLHSEAFFLLLSNFTGLRLHYLCPVDDDEEEKHEEMVEKKEIEEAPDGETAGSFDESSPADTSRGTGVCVCHFLNLCSCVCVF